MKEIKSFQIGDEVPSNAKFLSWEKVESSPIFYYEVTKAAGKTKKTDKNEAEIQDTINRTINYLNAKTGSRYTTKAKGHVSKIRARINEGATNEEFKLCIDNMAKEWLDNDKMRKYLRPETLFSDKFWGYISHKSGQQLTQEAFDELDKLLGGIDGE